MNPELRETGSLAEQTILVPGADARMGGWGERREKVFNREVRKESRPFKLHWR
jgi:hypothetical protein